MALTRAPPPLAPKSRLTTFLLHLLIYSAYSCLCPAWVAIGLQSLSLCLPNIQCPSMFSILHSFYRPIIFIICIRILIMIHIKFRSFWNYITPSVLLLLPDTTIFLRALCYHKWHCFDLNYSGYIIFAIYLPTLKYSEFLLRATCLVQIKLFGLFRHCTK